VIIDAHVRIGQGREAGLDTDALLATMDLLGIDAAFVAPCEREIAYDNRAGNAAATTAAASWPGRLFPYAVANPWRGAAAIDELAWAADRGARALCIDSSLQGFDLLDGLVDPLLDFAAAAGWFVYVRTGSPPGHLPLPTAELARRYPSMPFIMGRSGATDFWIDAAPALKRAANLYADSAYAPWDTVLDAFATDESIGTRRVVFSTDLPYATAAGELRRVQDWPLASGERAAVLGGTLASFLGAARS